MSEKENGERNDRILRVAYCSNHPLMELEPKENCFITNNIHSSFFPSVHVSLLQKVEEGFPRLSIMRQRIFEDESFLKGGNDVIQQASSRE